MKKRLYLSLLAVVLLLLCACAAVGRTGQKTPTTQPSAGTATTSPAVDIPDSTDPAHSALYLPQYTSNQILEYFEEIVLRMEYTDGTGDSSRVQKWKAPIRYRIYGEPTKEDLTVLNDLFAQLNEITGFPGIHEAADWEPANVTLHFLDQASFSDSFSAIINGEDAFGAVQFWYYNDSNEIYTADVGYRTDIDQTTRNSVLLEEIVNMLGVSDTVLREDSIVYQHSNDNVALSDVDWVILKLMYDPLIQCGMDLDGCRAMIRQLYY